MPEVIHKVVIHELVKDSMAEIQESNIRPAVLDPAHDAVKKLMAGVVAIYGQRNNNAHYGVFRTGDGRGDFPDKFEGYWALDQPSDEEFMDVTRRAMSRLYEKAEASHFATGGYIVFADYSNVQGRYFLVAMVKQQPGLTLTRELMPEELMRLDLSKLYQAARINFGKLAAYRAADDDARQELLYLSFISPTASKTASGYFITALGCAAGAAAFRALGTVFRESRRLFRETDGLARQQEPFTDSLRSYFEEKGASGESVKLSEISQLVRQYIPAEMTDQVDEIVDNFIAHLNSEECSVPPEFPVNKRALKRHTHIAGEGATWKLIFDRSALGDDEAANVYYNRQAGTLTINGIPPKMKSMIEEQLGEPTEE